MNTAFHEQVDRVQAMLSHALAAPVDDPEVQEALIEALEAVRDTYRIALDLTEKVH
jgi:hypothetical protein